MKTLLVLMLLGSSVAVAAERLPKWEAGIGIGGLYLPDYRGSDHYRGYLVPWPYVVYRGSALSLDREGLQTHIFGSTRVSLVANVGASTPVNSSNNAARSGMPNLGVAFEAGPMVHVPLWTGAQRRSLAFQLPLRGVLVTDARYFHGAGWISNPRLMLEVPHLAPADIDFDFSIGPLFANNTYHDYYYRVDERYATPSRPAYDPGAGYSGSRATLAATRRFGRWWVGTYLRYDNLAGSAFRDSPLLRSDHAFIASFGISYVFAQSRETVWR